MDLDPTSTSVEPAAVADDGVRKWLTVAVIVQFLLVVGVYALRRTEATNAEMMVLGAEIGFVSTVLNYYFGSSSGSARKSELLEHPRP